MPIYRLLELKKWIINKKFDMEIFDFIPLRTNYVLQIDPTSFGTDVKIFEIKENLAESHTELFMHLKATKIPRACMIELSEEQAKKVGILE